MSLMPLLVAPALEVAAILEDVTREFRHQDKVMAAEFGLRPYDYSKAKSGQEGRDLGFGRMLRASHAVQWALLRAWERALVGAELPAAPAQVSDADLIADLLVVVGQFKKRMARAALPSVERKSA